MTNTTTPAATECTTPSVLSVWFNGWTATPCPCDVNALCGACGPATGYDASKAENLPSERLYASRCASILPRPAPRAFEPSGAPGAAEVAAEEDARMTTKATVTASRARDNDGWIVRDVDGSRSFFSDAGGSWDVSQNGTLGQQRQGRLDIRAPKSPTAMRRFVAGLVMGKGRRIEVQS